MFQLFASCGLGDCRQTRLIGARPNFESLILNYSLICHRFSSEVVESFFIALIKSFSKYPMRLSFCSKKGYSCFVKNSRSLETSKRYLTSSKEPAAFQKEKYNP